MVSKIVSSFSVALLTLAITSSFVQNGLAWSNGGYSISPSSPKYGTHDWIAQHALDWLPDEEKQYIVDNLALYLYGTELPDSNQAPDGIGDTTLHHIYFNSNGALKDDSAAFRASSEFNEALTHLNSQDYQEAAKHAGMMTHYIADVAVFAHVMGTGTDWGVEKHHDEYETHVNQHTSSYISTFDTFLAFDGYLGEISPYDAAVRLAKDTTFGNMTYTAAWMDANYNWSNPDFVKRVGESLNLAVNTITEVLHALYVKNIQTENPTPTSEPAPQLPSFNLALPQVSVPLWTIGGAIILITLAVILALTRGRPSRPKQPRGRLVRLSV